MISYLATDSIPGQKRTVPSSCSISTYAEVRAKRSSCLSFGKLL